MRAGIPLKMRSHWEAVSEVKSTTNTNMKQAAANPDSTDMVMYCLFMVAVP